MARAGQKIQNDNNLDGWETFCILEGNEALINEGSEQRDQSLVTSAATTAFTLVELLAIVVTLSLCAIIAAPGFARTQPASSTAQCLNNLRRLTVGWRGWSMENDDRLLSSNTGAVPPSGTPRINWVTGNLDYNGANRSNWDTNLDLVPSPLWAFVGRSATAFKCPADKSVVKYNNLLLPRVRSYSMNGYFGFPEWLDATSATNWRTYSAFPQIVRPAHTFVFIGEHPDSINDGAFGVECTGAQPGDPPSFARIVDYPASSHHNSANLSFADGHVETHRWIGKTIRPPVTGTLPLNFSAADSWRDVQWLAANATVKR